MAKNEKEAVSHRNNLNLRINGALEGNLQCLILR